jgi:hypothetical protein
MRAPRGFVERNLNVNF